MGRDKASLPAPPATGPAGPAAPVSSADPPTPADPTAPADPPTPADPAASGATLAERTGAILSRHCGPAVEVGPGHSTLRRVSETTPGEGPLAAIAAGWGALRASGWHGPVVVVATDLPNLTEAMVAWLAGREGHRSVVPVASGRVQPLCARYCPADLDLAAELVAGGHRAMRALLEEADPELVPEGEWAAAAGGAQVLADVDTPEDLRRVTGA